MLFNWKAQYGDIGETVITKACGAFVEGSTPSYHPWMKILAFWRGFSVMQARNGVLHC